MEWAIMRMRGRVPVTITETQRAVLMVEGVAQTILGPGRHWVPRRAELVRYTLDAGAVDTPLLDAMLRVGPAHLTVAHPDEDHAMLVHRHGKVVEVLGPGKRAVYWTDAGPLTLTPVALGAHHEVAAPLARTLMLAGLGRVMTAFEVPQGFVGMLSEDGVLVRQLDPGTYWFWMFGRKHTVRLIDTRAMAHEVMGQEILTHDRVSVRVNLTATYRVTDPEAAFRGAKDFTEVLHRSMALAFRQSLGARTLAQLLENKGQVDTEAGAAVRAEMARLGVAVGEIALKDVVLPGDMREILNQVVAARHEAEASVIRRREEVNATRALLNTAKVMADNPVMLRLRELEALEAISANVDHLIVGGGTDGLLRDVAKLR
ncbi:MAG: slipin family protein [Pseudomonadota bacterium]